MLEDGLDFHRKSVHLWITPGHYNLLYDTKVWDKMGTEVDQANRNMEAMLAEEESKESSTSQKEQTLD